MFYFALYPYYTYHETEPVSLQTNEAPLTIASPILYYELNHC